MSNSGQIGGSKHSASHKMRFHKAKVECDDNLNNRQNRRAKAAMARKNGDALAEVSGLAAKYFDCDKEKVKEWLYLESDGYSPLERILKGEGDLVIKRLNLMLESKDAPPSV